MTIREVAAILMRHDEAVRKLRIQSELCVQILAFGSGRTLTEGRVSKRTVITREGDKPVAWFNTTRFGKFKIGRLSTTYETRPLYEFVREALSSNSLPANSSIREVLEKTADEFLKSSREIVKALEPIAVTIKERAKRSGAYHLPVGCTLSQGELYYCNGLHGSYLAVSSRSGHADYRFAVDFLREYLEYCTVAGLSE